MNTGGSKKSRSWRLVKNLRSRLSSKKPNGGRGWISSKFIKYMYEILNLKYFEKNIPPNSFRNKVSILPLCSLALLPPPHNRLFSRHFGFIFSYPVCSWERILVTESSLVISCFLLFFLLYTFGLTPNASFGSWGNFTISIFLKFVREMLVLSVLGYHNSYLKLSMF